ncbi:uncharacterized protein LOC142977391 [Anticarsia gemmatalis]|uniref:uncharacterized protein LOC142977391 n=1 Tax=Anticarsia gemmatalis TaxID=129554 RepID=UPI003F76D12C
MATSRVGICAEFSFAKNANNYGPYVITWKKYETCQGPKAVNLTTMISELVANETHAMVYYNTTFHSVVRIAEVKIQVCHINGIHKTTLWNYKVDKPCQHFAIASAMANYLPLQNNCIVKKCELYFQVNLTAIANQFFGSTFFYGEFLLKVNVLSNQGNVMCNVINILFSKKPT